jgi:hypothetical protein
VPVLFAFCGLFLEDVVLSYWAAPAVVGAGGLMAAALYAEHICVEPHSESYPAARFVLNVVTYLSAFGFYTVVYGFDVDLLPAAFAVGLVSMLLSIEIFREAEADPIRALVFAAVIGVIVAEPLGALLRAARSPLRRLPLLTFTHHRHHLALPDRSSEHSVLLDSRW